MQTERDIYKAKAIAIAHYTAQDYKLTPLREEEPTLASWQSRGQLSNYNLAVYIKSGFNLGWVLGEKDLVVDVDISPDAGGRASFMELEKDIGAKLQKTVKTPSGFHCYLQYEEEVKLHKTLKEYPGIEFLTKGNQCPIPGSIIRVEGWEVSYAWYSDNVINSSFAQPRAPEELVGLLTSEV